MSLLRKLALHSSVLLTLFLQIAIATEDRNSIGNNTTDKKALLVTSIYESLLSAIEMDSANEIEQFISFGADIDHRYKGDKTALMLATSMGSIDAIHVLLALGANPNLVSSEDMTALDYANESGNSLTIVALNSNRPAKKADTEITVIRKIQFLLGRLGYHTGEVDGEFGKRTKQSLKSFTKDTKQTYPAELSTRQVESLKYAFFQQDLNEKIGISNNQDSNILNKDSKEEPEIIKTIPQENTITISTDTSTGNLH